jgi:hypothetical protein
MCTTMDGAVVTKKNKIILFVLSFDSDQFVDSENELKNISIIILFVNNKNRNDDTNVRCATLCVATINIE